MPLLVPAEIAIPTARECLRILAPVAALVALNWIIRNTDAIIHRLFPHLQWERQLGWFNIRSERRAAAVLRAVGNLIYLLLAVALMGIVWGAVGVGRMQDAQGVGENISRLPALAAGLALWAAYLAGYLIPRLRRDYEEEELERFRAELAEKEPAEERHAAARTPHGPLLGGTSALAKSPRSERPR